MHELALRLMDVCGAFSLTRAFSARMARILMYHNFSGPGTTSMDALNVEGIRNQFSYLRRHFQVVPLSRIAERLASKRELDSKMVALTIDDGRHNCYEFFFPLLKEFELPATFFVVSSFIQGEDWIWTDKLNWLSEQPMHPDELLPGNLEPVFRFLNRLRPEDRNARIQNMAKKAGLSIPQMPPPKYAPCSWRELREMVGSGLVDIGSHTKSHPILSSITDEESWEELVRSRAEIEEKIGREITSFCFPNGMQGDFRSSQIRQVEEAGYICSVIAQFGLVRNGSNRYQMPRIGMARKVNTVQIAKFIDGFAYYQTRLKQAWSR